MKTHHSIILATLGFVFTAAVGAQDKPVQVYILSGQSNMVGIGQVDGGGSRWGREFIDPVLSIYPGEPDPAADYDKMEATQTLPL